MAQHFLLSPEARGEKTLLEIARMSNEEAFKLLCETRWGKDGSQCCPECSVIRKHHFIKVRKQFRCAEKTCGHTFSVTSGTKFAYHKKSYQDILYAIAEFANGVEGVAALRTCIKMGANHKALLLFYHKIREALFQSRDLSPMNNEVEIDGCYFHYYVRPANKRANRVDRRMAFNLNPNKRAVLAIRQRGLPGQGAKRTIVTVIKNENEREVFALAKKYIEPDTTIYTDNHSCYTSLASDYTVKQVNHAEEYSSDEGVNENQAESVFARMRKQFSHIHKCDPKFLIYYVNEIAWRDDNRRQSFYWQLLELVKKCLQTGQSRLWSKYWQGNRVTEDCLFVAN
ncbi:MAG: IS1595 family transposase [Methylotenera sp.]|nr:IS1595 family transposase [Methylotenera sp.]